ncbi:hypothetical protein GCM10023322_78080 [Rugosimonospora acidiphila]|uniref:Intracellular septation protein A n=1 Tax=Rugosimonospora acidiphila TaxID=556531 RepID=A0ABP9SPQ0_9ACTN
MSTTKPENLRAALIRSGVLDLAAPVATYYGLRAAGSTVLAATLLAAAIPLVNAAVTFARRRQLDQLACLTVVVLGVLAVAVLAGGGQRLALARDGLVTGTVGLVALATLAARRPLFFTVARPFGQDPGEDWDRDWAADAGFRHGMTLLTAVWGAGLGLDGAVKVILAYTLAPDLVPALAGVQYVVVLGGLIGFTVRHIRRRVSARRGHGARSA